MQCASSRETNENVKKDWNFVYVVFGICLDLQNPPIFMKENAFGCLLLSPKYFQQPQKPAFCWRKFGLWILRQQRVRIIMFYCNKYFQDIIIWNEIWDTLRVSQNVEYIFHIFRRVCIIFFFRMEIIKKKAFFFFFSTPAVGDIVCRACSI